jgi:hypothetical protein
MKNEEFATRLADANTIEELIYLRPVVSTQQVARIKEKIYDIVTSEGWEYIRMSTMTLKTIIGHTSAGTGSLTDVTVKNSRKLKKYNGKKVQIYVHEKFGMGSDSGIFIREARS